MIPAELYSLTRATWLTGPNYLGRREFLVETGDYFVPPWHPGVAVVLSESGPKAFVNVCRHRQSIILSDRGNVSQIRCSMHGWAWNLDGKSIACPGFNSGADLMTVELEETRGWMYARGSTLAEAAENNPHMGLDGYELLETNAYEFGCTWLDYINVSVDANHVPFVHPGLRAWIDCSNPEIVYGDGWSTQKAFFKDGSKAPGLAGIWWRTLVERFPNAAGECIWWAHIYPNVIIEHYADMFASVAVIEPTNAGCVVHEDTWVNRDLAGDTELKNAFSDMYPEIEQEDQAITLAQQSGRNLLTSMGVSDSGPYQNPAELGMEHFHQWLLDREADTPSFA